MATIRTAIQIQDNMSSAFRAMNNAMNMVISSFETLQDVSGNAVDTNSIQAARRELDNTSVAFNRIEDNIRNSNNQQQQFNNSVKNGESAADGLLGKIKGFIGAYLSMKAAGGVANLSDELVQTKARLNMMNDGLQTTEQLQQIIFQSAQRSRALYGDTAQAVSKMGILAKDAFSSNEEVVAFMEQINKQFTIAGTSAQGVEAATLQLTQAMGAGVLRGEELNSIFEQVPTIIQGIAQYMDVPVGKIKEMASEGKITADIVKKAMFAAANETNAQFESMPKTIGQIWVGIKNQALMAFQPVLLKINEIANNPNFGIMVTNISNGMATIANITLGLIDIISNVSAFFASNWSIIEPIIWGIIGALIVYNATMGIAWFTTLKDIAVKIAHAIASWAETAAIFALIVAQDGLNTALAACPITWIIMAIIILIAIFYAAVAAVNKFAGTSYSATGMICGAFMVAAAFIGNLIVTLFNFLIDLFVILWNFIASFANFFGNVFNDPVGSIARLFFDLVDTVLSLLQSLASAIDTIFGSSLSSSVQGWRNSLGGWVDKTFGKGTEVMAKMSSEDLHLGRFEYGSAWDAGNNFGKGIENKIGSVFDKPSMNDANTFNYDDLLANAEGANQGIGDTAGNTGAIKDSLEVTEEDLKYLRDLAEQEVINRFTTAEIKVDMTNYNSVNSDLDLDGIVDALAGKVEEQMNISAEGVH